MTIRPTPVVMVSSLTLAGAQESVLALKLGAVDVMAKPHGTHSIGLATQGDELVAKVIAAANVNVALLNPVSTSIARPKLPTFSGGGSSFPVVVIASSTGGPRALRMLVPALSGATGAAYIMVQHLPTGFSKNMADDLNELGNLTVREASPEEKALKPGEVLFAKAGYHLVVNRDRSSALSLSPPLWGVRPSADVTMVSAAAVFGKRLIGVVLTGMGCDGAAGLRAIKEQGGVTIAEHESTCVVYGMPRAAIESGVVDVIAPLDRMAEAIIAAASRVAEKLAA
jgi:two-component system chemotaxis response regulator CheB